MDDDNSWTIHDLERAPEPPTNSHSLMMMEGSASGMSSGALGGGLLSPRVLMGRSSIGIGAASNMPGGGSSSHHARRRHSGSGGGGGSAPSTPILQHLSQRPKTLGVRDRTWSAPSYYPQQNYYSVPNLNVHPSLFSPSFATTPSSAIMTTTTTANESPMRRRTLSVPEIPSSSSTNNNSSKSLRYLSQRPSLQEPPSVHRQYGRKRSGNSAAAGGINGNNDNKNTSNSNDRSRLSLPELVDNSPLRSEAENKYDYGDDENYYGYNKDDDDEDENIRLQPGFLSRHRQQQQQYLEDVNGDGDESDSSMIEPNSSQSALQLPPVLSSVGSIAAQNRLQQSSSSLVGGAGGGVERDLSRSLSSRQLQQIKQQKQQQQQQQYSGTEDPLEDSSHNQSFTNRHDDDDEDDDASQDYGNGRGKRRWKRPTMHQIATCVVMNVYAPCFWVWYGVAFLFPFCCKPPSAARSMRQPTERAILARLNVLVGLFALLQIGSALFFLIVTVSPNLTDRVVATQSDLEEDAQVSRLRSSTNIWNVGLNLYMLGVEAFVLVVAAVLTVRVVRNVNLVGAIRYLWVLLWILPFEIYFNIGLYDYFRVTDVWVLQYWRDPSLGWFREQFCVPSSTSNTLCAVPLSVNATEWCLVEYNSTSCASIREKAQKNTERWLLSFYYLNASFGLALICLLFLVVSTLEGIISKPLVRKSRQSNIPAWMSLPIVSCSVFGTIFTTAQTSVLNTRSDTNANWIGPLYLVSAGLFFISALLGWYMSVSSITNTRHKRNKMISITAFILLMGVISTLLIALFAASITFSSSFVKIPLTGTQRGDLACFIDQSGSCSLCDLPEGNPNRCPEWTVSDVTKVIQTQAKSSAALAAILMLYSFGALRFGWGMRKHIRMYQIQYI
ncbi:hypothetical protein ACA910_014690 [Epithemia clementina (nom. ined.)]